MELIFYCVCDCFISALGYLCDKFSGSLSHAMIGNFRFSLKCRRWPDSRLMCLLIVTRKKHLCATKPQENCKICDLVDHDSSYQRKEASVNNSNYSIRVVCLTKKGTTQNFKHLFWLALLPQLDRFV